MVGLIPEDKRMDFIDIHIALELIPQIVDELTDKAKVYYEEIGMYKHNIKQKLNPVLKRTEAYSNYFWNRLCKKSEKITIQYGDLTELSVEKLLDIIKEDREKHDSNIWNS